MDHPVAEAHPATSRPGAAAVLDRLLGKERHFSYGTMLVADDIGFWLVLADMLRQHGERLRAVGGTAEIAILDVLGARCSRAREIEAERGSGALLNLDHRLIRDLVARGQVLTAEQLDAARRMNEDQPGFAAEWFRGSVIASALSAQGWSPAGPCGNA